MSTLSWRRRRHFDHSSSSSIVATHSPVFVFFLFSVLVNANGFEFGENGPLLGLGFT